MPLDLAFLLEPSAPFPSCGDIVPHTLLSDLVSSSDVFDKYINYTYNTKPISLSAYRLSSLIYIGTPAKKPYWLTKPTYITYVQLQPGCIITAAEWIITIVDWGLHQADNWLSREQNHKMPTGRQAELWT